MTRTELLLGCGRNREKKLYLPDHQAWEGLITIDNNPDVNPDQLLDLEFNYLPFTDSSIDEIHAYEVLEHTGRQGDYEFFFGQFADFWRVLKPRGHLFATVPLPTSVWAWGDPSHRRVIPKENLIFLHQPSYEETANSPMSDFRYMYKADFDIVHCLETGDHLQFGLKAVKPSRCMIT